MQSNQDELPETMTLTPISLMARSCFSSKSSSPLLNSFNSAAFFKRTVPCRIEENNNRKGMRHVGRDESGNETTIDELKSHILVWIGQTNEDLG